MTLMAAILGRALVQAQPQPEESLSTAVRTTFASYPCAHQEKGQSPCGVLSWVILGNGPDDVALCHDHSVEELSRRVRKLLNGAWETK